jgi:carboxymethylenebutenolidase
VGRDILPGRRGNQIHGDQIHGDQIHSDQILKMGGAMPDITIKTANGESFSAYLARPTAASAPAIVLIQEIFGINHFMRETADKLAAEGFLVLCPDLFWRLEPGVQITDRTEEEWQKAFDLLNRFDIDLGVKDLIATLAHARRLDGGNGQAGVVGYCLGGKLAYLMATRSDTDCSVAYYGIGLDALLDEAVNIKKPLLMHIAEDDEFAPKEVQEKVNERLAPMELVVVNSYTGLKHAFCRTGGDNYNPEAADFANAQTVEFLRKHLG